MKESLDQAFSDSRQAANNYLAYILRQNDEQKEQANDLSHSLDSVMEGVNAVGIVAAMAAKESMQSHNTIFGMLKAMNTQQGLVTRMIVELRLNGGVGRGSGGGMLESAGMMGGLSAVAGPVLGIATESPWMLLPLAIGALMGGVEESDKESARRGELNHPNSLTNKALEASAEAERFINGAYHSLSLNPAPNPLMNGPGMLLSGWSQKDFPAVKTFGGAMSAVAAINEANDYLEATGQIPVRPRIRDDYSPNDEYGSLMRHNGVEPDEMTYGLNTEYDHLMRYNSQMAIAAMSPQPAQVVVQAAPPAAEPPNQTVTVHMNNNINGSFFDSRGFQDISDYLVKRIKDQLGSRGVRPSHDR